MHCKSCETFGNTKEPENTKEPDPEYWKKKYERREDIIASKYLKEKVKIFLSALCIGIVGYYSFRKNMGKAILLSVLFLIIAIPLNKLYRKFSPIYS
tara:strand:- start:47 stop:337 length:291 start_codon:yes stop_codon:yes gene_type:complete